MLIYSQTKQYGGFQIHGGTQQTIRVKDIQTIALKPTDHRISHFKIFQDTHIWYLEDHRTSHGNVIGL